MVHFSLVFHLLIRWLCFWDLQLVYLSLQIDDVFSLRPLKQHLLSELIEAEAEIWLGGKFRGCPKASISIGFVKSPDSSLLLLEHRCKLLLGFLLVFNRRIQSFLVLQELVVYSLLFGQLLICNGKFVLVLFLLSLAVALKLCNRLTAVDSLHLSVPVDNKQDWWIRVQKFNQADLNLELPELDQVLRTRELEEQDAILIWPLLVFLDRLISRAHLDEELVLNSCIWLNLRHWVKLKTPVVASVHAFQAPNFHRAFRCQCSEESARALKYYLRDVRTIETELICELPRILHPEAYPTSLMEDGQTCGRVSTWPIFFQQRRIQVQKSESDICDQLFNFEVSIVKSGDYLPYLTSLLVFCIGLILEATPNPNLLIAYAHGKGVIGDRRNAHFLMLEARFCAKVSHLLKAEIREICRVSAPKLQSDHPDTRLAIVELVEST